MIELKLCRERTQYRTSLYFMETLTLFTECSTFTFSSVLIVVLVADTGIESVTVHILTFWIGRARTSVRTRSYEKEKKRVWTKFMVSNYVHRCTRNIWHAKTDIPTWDTTVFQHRILVEERSRYRQCNIEPNQRDFANVVSKSINQRCFHVETRFTFNVNLLT